MEPFWYVGVSYCLEKHEWGSLDDKLEEIVGEPLSGAGTGFGYRDMDWDFSTEEAAQKAQKKLETCGLDIELHGISYISGEDDGTETDDGSHEPEVRESGVVAGGVRESDGPAQVAGTDEGDRS